MSGLESSVLKAAYFSMYADWCRLYNKVCLIIIWFMVRCKWYEVRSLRDAGLFAVDQITILTFLVIFPAFFLWFGELLGYCFFIKVSIINVVLRLTHSCSLKKKQHFFPYGQRELCIYFQHIDAYYSRGIWNSSCVAKMGVGKSYINRVPVRDTFVVVLLPWVSKKRDMP